MPPPEKSNKAALNEDDETDFRIENFNEVRQKSTNTSTYGTI